MPYRRAHFYLLLLFPLAGLAFWRAYFSQFAASPYAFHVHGITASLWIALLASQSWAIHNRRNALHRTAGLASFALFPFFVAGGLLVLQSMAGKFAARSDDFYNVFGARLGTMDALTSLALPCFFYLAIRRRRKVHLHAGYMLAPVLFLLSPILSRLAPALPPFAIEGPQYFYRFGYGLHASNAIALAIAALCWQRAPKGGRPFLLAGGLIALHSLAFETLGRWEAWETAFSALGTVPTPLVVSLGLAAGVAAAAAGWAAGGSPPRRVAPA